MVYVSRNLGKLMAIKTERATMVRHEAIASPPPKVFHTCPHPFQEWYGMTRMMPGAIDKDTFYYNCPRRRAKEDKGLHCNRSVVTFQSSVYCN